MNNIENTFLMKLRDFSKWATFIYVERPSNQQNEFSVTWRSHAIGNGEHQEEFPQPRSLFANNQ